MKKVTKDNCLLILNPKLAAEWHPTKNGKLTPKDVICGSGKEVWWKCNKCGNEWEAIICNRNKGEKTCLRCNSLGSLNPKLAAEWHPTKNGKITPYMIMPGSNKKAEWICEDGHEWSATVNSRNQGSGCPFHPHRSNKTIDDTNCLAIVNPKLVIEWHPTKNGNLTPYDVSCGSNKKVWWKCKKGHEWQATIGSRNLGCGCPYCSNQLVCKDNCLAAVYPELAKEWDYDKNGDITPEDVVCGARRKVGWICSLGHRWEQTIDNRSRNHRGCPYCCNRKIDKNNCLLKLNPELAKEWDYDKNVDISPSNVSPHGHQNVGWKCKKGHKWDETINSRTRDGKNNCCPYCSGQRVCIENCLATLRPHLAKQWHPTKNGNLTPYDVAVFSKKYAHWKCEKGHEWTAVISNRSIGRGCPHCLKVILKDETSWDSIPEAYMYLMFKEQGLNMFFHGSYGKELGNYKYDFYFPDQNKYVEITSYPEITKYVTNYISKIIKKYNETVFKKKEYVEKILRADFELIRFVPTMKQRLLVMENLK